VIHWIEQLQTLRDEGHDGVLVTIASVRGSAPRELGARMIVTPQQTVGSIGGGRLEYECSRIAAGQLKDDAVPPRVRRRFPLGANLGQCCGGVVEIMFEKFGHSDWQWFEALFRLYAAREAFVSATTNERMYLVAADSVMASGNGDSADSASREIVAAARALLRDGKHAVQAVEVAGHKVLLETIADSDMHIAIFGAGHVGSACVAALSKLDCRIRWIDSRRNVFPDVLPSNVTCIESRDPALEAGAMPPGAFYLVMTHSHPLDYVICQHVLGRADFAYCGLIGSRSKRRRFEKLARDGGLAGALLERLTCPIGIAGISGKRPEEIAVAVSAELLQTRDAGRSAEAYDRAQPALSVVAKSDKQ
jgi:xanthine dehydrogenase accessory factor